MNSLNLKKKIAFISSLAMLAATAAYLPADIAKQVGFGSSIVEAAYEAQTHSKALSTMVLYVTVDGKYVAKDSGTSEYTVYDTLKDMLKVTDAQGATEKPIVVDGATKLEELADTPGNKDDADAEADSENASLDNFTVKSGADIAFPYDIVKGGSKIAVVAVAAADDMTLISSTKSVEVTLDEHGLATVPKQSSYIIGQSDDSNYKDGVATTGQYETVDLSGLKFKVTEASKTIGSTDAIYPATISVTSPATQTGKEYVEYGTTDPENPTYQYTKVGDVYARNVKVKVGNVTPGGKVVVDLKPATNWTVTGTGVSDGKITLTMNDDNKAQSGLITYAKGDQKEYYILNVDNTLTDLGANAKIVEASVVSPAVAINKNTYETTDSYKIVKTQKAMATSGGKQFVNVYTIYTNNADKNAHSYTLENQTITATTSRTAFAIAQDTGLTGLVTPEFSLNKAAEGNAEFTGADTEKANVTFKSKDGASCATPVLKTVSQEWNGTGKEWKNASDQSPVYFQIVVTNEYEIEAYADMTDEDSKDIKSKVAVKGQEITKPEDPKKPGYTFEAWVLDDNAMNKKADTGEKEIFVVGNSVQQKPSGKAITPNVQLAAKYAPNNYTAVFDANGGTWGQSAPGGFVTNSVDADKNVVTISKATNSKTDIASDFVITNEANSTNNNGSSSGQPALKRTGYKLLGWSNVKNAEKPLTPEEFDKIRPDENNGSLTLYAVWEAREVEINFEYIKFNNNGTSLAGTSASDYSTWRGTVEGAVHNDFNGAPATLQMDDGNGGTKNETAIKVKTDANLGTLPTPVLKGYTFDGWYKKVVTTKGATLKDNTYTAVKVSSLSKLSQEMLDGDTAATLFAKFKQNSYKVTYDLDGGEFNKDQKPAKTFKFVATDASAAPAVALFDEDGKSIAAEVSQTPNTINPTKGSGYFVFDGWTVKSGDKSETIPADKTLNNMTFASDVTVKANWKVASDANKNKSSIALNANGGDFYTVSDCEGTDTSGATTGSDGYCDTHNAAAAGEHKVYSNPVSLTGKVGTPGTNVADTYAVDSDKIDDGANGTVDKIVARPGYTFTGWYSDKECTQPFNFTKFPAEGTEVTAYAGWKADTATRYHIQYNLIDADGAIVTPAEGAEVYGDFQFQKTFMGTTDSEVTAIGRTITYNKTKYVFDAKLSTGLNVTDTVTAEFNKDSLDAGKFENDSTKYVTLQAVFVDESVAPATLGTVNDTVVDTNGKVTWSPVDNAVAYKVVKKVGDKTYYSDKITATEYKFGSVPETAYSVRVVAFDKDGNKTWGKEVTVAAPVDPYAIGEIKNVKVDADRKTVTWDKVDNAVTYKVVKKIGDKTYYTSEIADTSYTFATATQGAFTVNVVAINVNGDRKWSDDVKVEAVKSNLGAAGNVKVGSDNKTLTWSAVDNAVSYRVAKIVGGKTYYTAKTTKLTTTLGSALKEGNKVYLIAYDKNGKSVTGPQTKISSVAKATKVAVAADGKTVTWTAAKNAAKYQVAKLINGKTYYGTKVDAKTTKYTFGSAATAGTQVFVITFDADGNSSYSDAVLVK